MEFNDFGLLEPSWEYSGRPLETSRSLFGASWVHLGLSWATRGLLAPSWELSWSGLGANLGSLGRPLGRLGAHLGWLRGLLGTSWAVLNEVFRASWTVFKAVKAETSYMLKKYVLLSDLMILASWSPLGNTFSDGI